MLAAYSIILKGMQWKSHRGRIISKLLILADTLSRILIQPLLIKTIYFRLLRTLQSSFPWELNKVNCLSLRDSCGPSFRSAGLLSNAWLGGHAHTCKQQDYESWDGVCLESTAERWLRGIIQASLQAASYVPVCERVWVKVMSSSEARKHHKRQHLGRIRSHGYDVL